VEKPSWKEQVSPEKLFRLSVLLSIVGWGLSAIYIVSHVGSMEVAYGRARDFASYFFSANWIFIFFYAQYRGVYSSREFFQSSKVPPVGSIRRLRRRFKRQGTTDTRSQA